MKSDVFILSRVISVWAWQIIAIIFFSKAVSFLMVREYVWMFGFVGAMFICMVYAFKRKHEISEVEDEV